MFSASRLTVARQKRGLRKKELAEQIGRTGQAVTNYEDGMDVPPLEIALRISSALRFPCDFFFQSELEEISAQDLSFRARRSMTASLRDVATAAARLAFGVLSPAFRRRFRYPSVSIPDLMGESPEFCANYLREIWELGFGPIDNMIYLLEAKGAEVYWLKEDSPSVDAFSFWKSDNPYVFHSSTRIHGDRCRYTSAHELGHLAMHQGQSDLDSRDLENEANAFAGAFLLPANQFRLECPKQFDIAQFMGLKKRWQVSIQALVRRARDLGIFSEWQYENACKRIAREGWRTTEPGSFEPERSFIHQKIFEALAAKGTFPEKFAKNLYLPSEDLKELVPAAGEIEIDNVITLNQEDFDRRKTTSTDRLSA